MIFESEALDLPSNNFHGAFHQILGVPYFQRDPVVGCAVPAAMFSAWRNRQGCPDQLGYGWLLMTCTMTMLGHVWSNLSELVVSPLSHTLALEYGSILFPNLDGFVLKMTTSVGSWLPQFGPTRTHSLNQAALWNKQCLWRSRLLQPLLQVEEPASHWTKSQKTHLCRAWFPEKGHKNIKNE